MRQRLKRALSVVLMLAALVGPGFLYAQTNLLQNGGFEGNYIDKYGDGKMRVPTSWEAWWVDQPQDCRNYRPNFNPGTRTVEGAWAASYWNQYQTYKAGFYQTVTVPANAKLRFTANGQSISSEDGDQVSEAGASVTMRVGIDPLGQSSAFASGIVWSGGATSTLDTYQSYSVEATAQGTKVTVILWAEPAYCYARNETYWDAASLVVIGDGGGDSGGGQQQQPTQQVQQPQPAAVQVQVAEPGDDGVTRHEVKAGETIWLIAAAYGVTPGQIRELNDIPENSSLIYVGDVLVIKTGGEGGAAEPEPTDPPQPTVTPMPTTPPDSGVSALPTTSSDAGGGEAAADGAVCVLVYGDRNGNGARDPGEMPVAGYALTLEDGERELSSYQTTGAEPYCFSGLAPGDYYVVFQGDVRAVLLKGGQRLPVEFGVPVEDDGGTDPVPERPSPYAATSERDPVLRVLLAGIGAVVMMGGMAVAGGLVFLILRRRGVFRK
jgi:LysM repeat protein